MVLRNQVRPIFLKIRKMVKSDGPNFSLVSAKMQVNLANLEE